MTRRLPSEDGCRTVLVDGEPVVVRGDRPPSGETLRALAEVVRAARDQLGEQRRQEDDEHPASWLDCTICRVRSKAGAKPPRCKVWMARHGAP